MSRLANLDPNVLRAIFAQEADDTLISALIIEYNSLELADNPIRITDNFTHRFQKHSSNASLCVITDIRTDTTTTISFGSNNGFAQNIINTSDEEELFYGTISDSLMYLFLPFKITLPSEEVGAIPTAKVEIHDVTRYLTPIIRTIFEPPKVTIKLMLYSNTSIVPISLDDFYLAAITYDANTVSGDITIESFVSEPFPAHSFVPSIFPGAF